MQQRRGAFTIVELLVAMAIIGILLAVALPAVTEARRVARRTECLNDLRNIRLAMAMCDETHGRLLASAHYYVASAAGGGFTDISPEPRRAICSLRSDVSALRGDVNVATPPASNRYSATSVIDFGLL